MPELSPLDVASKPPRSALESARVEWLDGVRALAALFVVFHHSWLMSVGGYPGNNGPWYTDWLIYGHLAVSVFIVVSGFSLSLSPSRHGMQLERGGKEFLRRRFWRIVPPYWAALVITTLLIGGGLYAPEGSTAYGVRDMFVHAALLQDALGNTSPNGAFWSIAVEWHIYFLFPLLLVGFRRWGIKFVLPAATVLVVGQHLLGQAWPVVGKLDRFTPAYLVLFVAGASAAWLAQRRTAPKTAMLCGVILTLCAGFLILAAGSEQATRNYFWLDLLVGIATASLFVAFAQGRFRWLTSLLAVRPLAFLGSFAFSLYLIHAPVLAMLTDWVVRPQGLGMTESLGLLLLIGSPCSVAAAYAFFLVFERPFLTIRSFRQLVRSMRSSISAAFTGGRSRGGTRDTAPVSATMQMGVTEQ